MKDKWLQATIIASFIFISFNLWLVILNIFLLRNFWIQDASQINQALASTIFSHLFFYGYANMSSFFTVHPEFFFFSILPFFSIFPNFIAGYAIQYALLYSAAIPLYLIARKIFGDGKYAFLFSLAYLFYPGISNNPGEEQVTMFIGLAIYAIYFYRARRKIPFFISFTLMLSTVEFVPFIGIFFFIYAIIERGIPGKLKMFIKKEIRAKAFFTTFYDFFILSSIILSILFIVADNQTLLYFSHGTHPIFINIQGTNFFSLTSLINGLKTDTFTKTLNMIYYNGPFMFLSFLDPIFILQIPWFLVTLVTTNGIYFAIPVYYGAFIAAFVPVGFLYGMRRITENMDRESRRKIVKRVVVLVLVLNLLSLAGAGSLTGAGAIQYYYSTATSPITPQDQGAVILSSLLKQGDTVLSGSNEMPVVGLYDWNDTFYGWSPEQYLMFRNQSPHMVNGVPIDLSKYGFYAAAGQFFLYKMNYSGPPVFNYYNYTSDEVMSQNTKFSFFTPPGNYTLNVALSNVKYAKPVTTGSDSEKNFDLKLGNAIAIPFRLNYSAVLKAVAIEPTGYGGVYVFGGMITSSASPQPYGSLSGVYYPLEYFNFNGIRINANRTYYFWYIPAVWISSNTGGVQLPISSANGTSYLATATGSGLTNVTKLNFTVPITLFLESKTPATIPIQATVGGLDMNGTIGAGTDAYFPVNVSFSQQLVVSIQTNLTDYLSYYGSNITVTYYHQKHTPTIFLLDYPILILLPILAGGLAVIFILGRLDFKSSKKAVHVASRNVSFITFAAFWAFFVLGWENIIPFLYNYTLFKILGVIIALSLLVTLITYDWE